MFSVIFNSIRDLDFGVKIIKRPSIQCPKRRYRDTEVEGRNSRLYEDLKTYDDIEITIQFNFLSKTADGYNTDYRKIKKWLKGDGILKFSDDLSYFYVVNKVVIDTPERVLKRLGKFQATFVCEPFQYLEEGQQQLTLPTSLYNDYEECQPTYYIQGEGLLNLTHNGKIITANVGQSLIIDTKLGLCYRADGTLNNVALNGLYEDLFLTEGNNTFAWTNGFTIKIKPNWRCL